VNEIVQPLQEDASVPAYPGSVENDSQTKQDGAGEVDEMKPQAISALHKSFRVCSRPFEGLLIPWFAEKVMQIRLLSTVEYLLF